ncbi:hypothetical protein [Candidatus Venteria ishoeyi]|uniref:Uncharacterized protein n=1 Tax=Candidatus Venteria ishoeyi TaxID=1899563 RepID=A0A1H6FDF2_9GAMM|nr:hypothetical protein [Candidatus Venteria ishoeyi]SEH08120.1 Uncharacterised protein [Candidatus Venteria ishoeyi]
MTKPMIIYGNMPYKKIALTTEPGVLQLLYWDLWIALMLVEKCDKDWDTLLQHIRGQIKAAHYKQSGGEALAAHIHRLRELLDKENISIAAVYADADEALLIKQKKKALKKVWALDFQGKEKTEWMLQTPRLIKKAHAMRGYWHRFPVNPLKYASVLEKKYKKSGYYTEDQSFSLEDKLNAFFNKLPARISPAENFAAHRAFLSVIIEKMEMVDDSYGVIGDLYIEVFRKYIEWDRTKLEIRPEDFFQDILELIIWEDYGMTDSYEADFFKALSSAERPIVKAILIRQQEELASAWLDYQSKNAAKMLEKYKLR